MAPVRQPFDGEAPGHQPGVLAAALSGWLATFRRGKPTGLRSVRSSSLFGLMRTVVTVSHRAANSTLARMSVG